MKNANETIATLKQALGVKFRTEILERTKVSYPTLTSYLDNWDLAPTDFRATVLAMIKERKAQDQELKKLAA